MAFHEPHLDGELLRRVPPVVSLEKGNVFTRAGPPNPVEVGDHSDVPRWVETAKKSRVRLLISIDNGGGTVRRTVITDHDLDWEIAPLCQHTIECLSDVVPVIVREHSDTDQRHRQPTEPVTRIDRHRAILYHI